jgi:hypothetical protein
MPLVQPLPSGLLASLISNRCRNLAAMGFVGQQAGGASRQPSAIRPDRPQLSGSRRCQGNNNSPSASIRVGKEQLLGLPYSHPIDIQCHAGCGHAGQIASFPVFPLLHAENEKEVLSVKDGRRTL